MDANGKKVKNPQKSAFPFLSSAASRKILFLMNIIIINHKKLFFCHSYEQKIKHNWDKSE